MKRITVSELTWKTDLVRGDVLTGRSRLSTVATEHHAAVVVRRRPGVPDFQHPHYVIVRK